MPLLADKMDAVSTPKESINHLDLEPQAGLTCASACIRLQYKNHYLPSAIYKPVYTHQIFQEEVIPGYQPFPLDIQEAHELAKKAVLASSSTTSPSSLNNSCKSQSSEKGAASYELSPLHDSFYHPFAVHAVHRMQVTVYIEPSCKSCSVQIHTAPMSVWNDGDSPKNKESKLSGQKRKMSPEGLTAVAAVPKAGVSSVSPMTRKEILHRLSKSLPQIINIHDLLSESESERLDEDCESSSPLPQSDTTLVDGYLEEPIGSILSTYKSSFRNDLVTLDQEKSLPVVDFVLTLADGNDVGVNEYHQQVQKLALFYIENADEVDLTSDEGGGNWKVVYLFARHKSDILGKCDHDQQAPPKCKNACKRESVYSLVGYMTLFTFYSPLKKPRGGNVLRICQALVLPPFQRQGHGKAMMAAVYDYARGSKSRDGNGDDPKISAVQNVVEVNVEDPAPGFSRMRDAMDYALFEKLFVEEKEKQSKDIQDILDQYISKDTCPSWKPLTQNDATILAAEAKITKVQIHAAYEIHKLARMKAILRQEESKWQQYDDADTSDIKEKRENIMKEYRLMVKKRLNHFHREEIGAHGISKAEKQAKLSELYEETYSRYNSVLGVKTRS